MELSKYILKKVRIELINGHFYEGYVLNADKNSIEIKDRNGKQVSLTKQAILYIREVGE
jgi:hypothetical protein